MTEKAAKAAGVVANAFAAKGWSIRRQPGGGGRLRPDLLIRRNDITYAVEIEVAAEGRSDRLVPLWAQTYLQALRVAGDWLPLAVVAAPRVAPSVAEKILRFAEDHGPDAGAGVIDYEGYYQFRGPGLDGVASSDERPALKGQAFPRHSGHLFSDLNQWMLKVLLAPELPSKLLSAPRGRYRNASQLARAAKVSVMSASRLVRQLEREGYLHESTPNLRLVRREDLFQRWQQSIGGKSREVPMRFLFRHDLPGELDRLLGSGRACLGLFAAADALGLGFVSGGPPHVYLERLDEVSLRGWKRLAASAPEEAPDLFLRQAPAPQSVFRGLVMAGERPVSDILQVWLDVSSHPARGREQGHHIWQRVLAPVARDQ